MRLSSKIHLYSTVLFAMLLVVMNLSIYYLFYWLTLNSQREQVEAQAATIERGIREAGARIPVEELLRAYVPLDGMLRIVAQTSGDFPPITSPSQSALSQREVSYYAEKTTEIIRYANLPYVFVSVPTIWMDGEVINIQVTVSLREAEDNLRILRLVLVAVTAVALLPAIASSRVLGTLITKPISSMTHTMREIQDSGHFKRLELVDSSEDELMEMGDTFNRMIDLLESNYKKQEQFVSNASHELKTPLTVIEGYANLLKRKGLDRPDLFRESIDAIHSEAIRMKEMTERLLLLARDREKWHVDWELLDLLEIAEESAKAFRNAYGRDVYTETEESVIGYADKNLLRQLLFIFLDNARKYSDEPIVIQVGHSHAVGWIRIIDRGIGIPFEDIPKVFDRFYRVDPARSRKSGGAGLGLSLAKEIADAIGARIDLESREGVGTTVTVSLRETRV
ncbi:sensor histidine kinase [Brevibacillus choshinensis]|uniref:histidine kinase n=1 Tax=Brevibacillus choshinensis TaxID=54911 RepID=A0ABX7FV44_BRECH|nr:HAMP domain-containing sensor histidine kinase [Brevibacillus choshinensis]QRG68860.1 HAMP domain-containing histidine kinase [Brevibacillus choshinensis]